MRHGFKKYKFSHGQDSDRMLIRKLIRNFLNHGKIETTISKVKAVKPKIDKIVAKIKRNNQADVKKLQEQLGEIDTFKSHFESIRESLAKHNSGYVRIIKKGMRHTDGALMARLEWAHPVISKEKVLQNKETKKEVKPIAKVAVNKK